MEASIPGYIPQATVSPSAQDEALQAQEHLTYLSGLMSSDRALGQSCSCYRVEAPALGSIFWPAALLGF
ncbi:hypothetical protein NDU88_003833 [Pleurodeles waltl]|uniref:Uncharacterized protein n=1 Tax=Pleurodeles waltl TaxID=8319 RepID=A0AAV7TQ89_PLEWA|nr:hypothetical protein NDU88_003833 [Pleurodeles waltl]